MAARTVKQLSSPLTLFPGTFASADTVVNKTLGVLTVVRAKAVTRGGGEIIAMIEGSEVVIPIGGTSAAITLGTGEKLYILATAGGMSSTVDKVTV